MFIDEIEQSVCSCISQNRLVDELTFLHNAYPLRYGCYATWKSDEDKKDNNTGMENLRLRSAISILFTEERKWNEFRKRLENIDSKASDPSFLIRVCLILLKIYPCSKESVTNTILEETAESLSTKWNKKELSVERIPDFVIVELNWGTNQDDSSGVLVDQGNPDEIPSPVFYSAKDIVIKFCQATLLRAFIALARLTPVPYEITYDWLKDERGVEGEREKLFYVVLKFSIEKLLPPEHTKRLKNLPSLVYNDIILERPQLQKGESREPELQNWNSELQNWNKEKSLWRFLELKIQNKECQENEKEPNGDFWGIGSRDRGKLTDNSLIWKELGLHRKKNQKDSEIGNNDSSQERGTKSPQDKSEKSSILDKYRVLATRSIAKFKGFTPDCKGTLKYKPPQRTNDDTNCGRYGGGRVPEYGEEQSRYIKPETNQSNDWVWYCEDTNGVRVRRCYNYCKGRYFLRKYDGYLYFKSLENKDGYKKCNCVRCDKCDKEYLEETKIKESRRHYCISYVNANCSTCMCCGDEIKIKSRKISLYVPDCGYTRCVKAVDLQKERRDCLKFVEWYLGIFFKLYNDSRFENYIDHPLDCLKGRGDFPFNPLENETYFDDISQKIAKDSEFKKKLSRCSKGFWNQLQDPKYAKDVSDLESVLKSNVKFSHICISILIAWDFLHSVGLKEVGSSQNLKEQFNGFWERADSRLPKDLRRGVRTETLQAVKIYVTYYKKGESRFSSTEGST